MTARKKTSGRRQAPATQPQTVSESSPWMTLEQAAAYLGIKSHVTLRRLIRDEGLPVVRLSRRVYRTRAAWVDAWLSRRGREQEAE